MIFVDSNISIYLVGAAHPEQGARASSLRTQSREANVSSHPPLRHPARKQARPSPTRRPRESSVREIQRCITRLPGSAVTKATMASSGRPPREPGRRYSWNGHRLVLARGVTHELTPGEARGSFRMGQTLRRRTRRIMRPSRGSHILRGRRNTARRRTRRVRAAANSQ